MSIRLLKTIVLNGLWYVLGRRNLVRLARYLSNESRLDAGMDIYLHGERMVQSCVNNFITEQEGPVIFDVGANIGLWSKSFLDEIQDASAPLRVYAFEPCEGTYQTLLSNVKTWGLSERILPRRFALSSKNGESVFYSLGSGEGRNSLHPHWNEPSKEETVVCRTIDTYCLEENIAKISFLKIDAEGHDLDVIYGAKAMLQARKIDMVQFEYNSTWIESRRFLRDAFTFLNPLGYSIGKITRKGIELYPQWDFELETFRQGNYLAMQAQHSSLFPRVKWWNQ